MGVADSLGLSPAGHSLTLELRKRLFSLTHCRTCNLSIACFKSINHTTLITKDRTRRSFVISGGSGWIRTSSGFTVCPGSPTPAHAQSLGAGSGNRTRISSLEGLHTSLCTMPATNSKLNDYIINEIKIK